MDALELIKKYTICYDGPDTIAVHGTVNEADIALIQLAKPQILAVLTQQNDIEMEQDRRNRAILEAIPGVAAYRACLRGAYPGGLEALEGEIGTEGVQTARAVVECQLHRSSKDPDMAFIARKAYKAFIQGQDPLQVCFQYGRDVAAFQRRSLWRD